MPSGGNTKTTTQSGPPPQVLANYQQVFGQAQNVAQQPYQAYDSSRLAGFTPQQIAGFGNINTAINSSQPFLNAASQYTAGAADALDPSTFGSTVGAYQNPLLQAYLNAASQRYGSAEQYSENAAQGLNGGNFASTVGNFYNPYAQSVIAPTQALFNEQNAEQFNQVRGNAAAQGAFGGDREAVAEAQTARQQQLAQAPVLAQLQSTGYQQAVQNALASAGLQQQTAGTLLNAGQQFAGLGNLQQQGYNAATSADQANAWLKSQAGFGMGNLANEAQSLGLQGANAQIGAGGMQQQLAQQELNIPYQDFLTAQGYPFQTTNWLEGAATGLGSLSGQQGSTTQPGPSIGSQIGGGLLSAAAIAAMFAAKGGRVEPDKLRTLRSLQRGIAIPQRQFGGAAPNPAMLANPMVAKAYSGYQDLPTERLQELALQMPQNPLIRRALSMRHAQPQSEPIDPLQAGVGQMQSAPGGFASGGDVGDDYSDDLPLGFQSLGPWMQPPTPPRPDIGITSENTTDWRDSAPPLGQTAGLEPATPAAPYADFRMPPGGRPQDQLQPAYADSRLMPGGMPQDFLPPDLPPLTAGMAAVPHFIRAAYHPPSGGGISGVGPAPLTPPSNLGAVGGDLSLGDGAAQAPTVEPPAAEHPASGGSSFADKMSGPWGTLLAAGLGMMAGTSPYAGVNIGRGGLEGLKFGEQVALRHEQQALRMQQAADLAQYRRDMSGIAQQRIPISQQRADTYQQSAENRALYNQQSLASRNNIADRAAELRARGLDQQAANQQAMMEWRRGNQDLRSQGLDIQRGRAITSAAQGQYRLDQADTRIANAQANAQAAQQIRRQALQQTKDMGEQRMIQTATNSDIHAAAQLAAGLGVPYAKALKQIKEGRGSAEMEQGLTPGTTTGTAPDQTRPSLSSIFGQ